MKKPTTVPGQADDSRRRRKKEVPTTKIISEIAGVSKSTVSRALQNDERISVEMRKKILGIARKIGYHPNAFARSLATKKSGVVGIVLTETENYFYQESIQKLGRVALKRGLELMLFQIPQNGTIADVIPSMVQYRLDGCLVIPAVQMADDALEVCNEYDIAVVLLNRVLPKLSSVSCDNVLAGRTMAEHLIAGGHKRIGFVAGRPTSTGIDRSAGFTAGLAAAGHTPFVQLDGKFSYEGAYEAVLATLKAKEIPDALGAANDLMAFGAMDAIRKAGLRVPEDVSVIGADNSRLAAWPAYDLTTIAQPIELIFDRALALIVDRTATHQPETVFIQGDLVVRSSTRNPPE